MANLEIPSTSPVDTQSNKKSTAVQFNVDRQCPVQYVTVYNDRAEVTRLVQHHFDAEGTYDLVIQGFSPSVDLTSLHVSGATSKACTILEVSYQTRNEDSMVSSELTSIDQLQNEVEQIQLDLDKHEQQLARLTKQRTWLDGRASKLMNQDGQMNNNDLEMMQQFLEFYHKNLFKLDGETTSEQLLIKDMKRKQDGLRKDTLRRGADGQAQHQKTIREVTITIHISMSNIDVSLEIAYLITNCSWNASYDVRINNSEGARPRTQLTYYGSIVNQSQENWIDVQLSLSTATPSLSGDHPKLGTLKIDYYTPRRHYGLPAQKSGESLSSYAMNDCITEATAFKLSSRKFRSMSFRGRKHLRSSDASIDEEDSEINHSVNVLETHTEASLSSSSFAIPRRATIEADGKPHKVTIGVLDLTSTFTYTVIPKFSTHAYLKAKTINTSDKQLLSGQASIFMDNNFITRSSIENVCVGDTFDLSLGTDATIKVDYKPVKKLADTQGFISKVKHETIRHETRLVNTKSMEVTVFVYQQVPLPTIEKIKVKLNQPDLRAKEQGLNYTVTMDDSNNLEWKCVLLPRGECRLPLEYTIEWPADKQIEYADS